MPENNSKSLSTQRFDRYADNYVSSPTHAKGQELDRLLAIARPQPDWIVLDVATGGGHTALKFAPHVARVIATDLAPRMLTRARAFITGQGVENVTFEPADAEDLPFEVGTFDLVTCRIAPHHFPDCGRFVLQAARVLKPGGLLLVQDQVAPEDEAAAASVNEFERLRDPSHHRAYSASQWASMFEAAGLRVEHIEQVAKPHLFLAWTQRQECAPEVVDHLITMVQQAPPALAKWIEPQNWGTPEASIVNRHIILAGRKDTGGA